MDMQDGLVLDLDEADPVITKQVDADLLRVVEPGPELIDHLLGISDAGQLEMATGSLTHPQEDIATTGVGECAVGWPELLGQRSLAIAPLSQLALHIHAFAQGGDVLQGVDFKHRRLPLPAE